MNTFAEAELNENAVEIRMLEYIRHVPMVAKPLGIQMENEAPNKEDVARLAKERLFEKVKLG